MRLAESVDAVYDLIDNARGVLTYEEREALADALLAGAQGQRRRRGRAAPGRASPGPR
jgi:hypothetical protein